VGCDGWKPRSSIVKNNEKPIANPSIVLREEFDDWAVLFDPDTSHGFGLNPTSVFVWKLLDGGHTIDELLDEIRRLHEGVPEGARDHIGAFVDALVAEGIAAYGDTGFYRETSSHFPLGALNEVKPFPYEAPRLVNLSSGQEALGVCASHGSQGGSCYGGAGATSCCDYGGCGTPSSAPCCSGTCGGATCGSGTGACDSYCFTGTGNNANCGYGSGPGYQCLNGIATGNGQCRCGSGGGCTNGGGVC
jgi:SynChlorMet cassette protein ScmD